MMIRKELHRIEPWSAVRVGFFFGLLCGFIFGLLNGWAVKYLAEMYGGMFTPPGSENLVNLGGGAVWFLAVSTALVFSLFWSFMGGVFAIFYNLVARWFGGIEVGVVERPLHKTQTTHDGGVEVRDDA